MDKEEEPYSLCKGHHCVKCGMYYQWATVGSDGVCTEDYESDCMLCITGRISDVDGIPIMKRYDDFEWWVLQERRKEQLNNGKQ